MTSKTTPDVHVVILAGGQGTRFWPISRMKRPKQFLSISSSGESLIQATARRVQSLGSAEPLVMTNIMHKPLILEHVPNARVICEPVARNTAASIGLAALHLARANRDAVMVVLPADHAVKEEKGLLSTLATAIHLATEQEVLVTVGIEPTYPNTGYGYVRRGAQLNGHGFMVRRFFEKPSLERAIEYCQSGDFYWNSGMFVWRAGVLLEAIEEHMPQLFSGLKQIDQVIGSASEEKTVREVFEGLESISIDFGVLELSRNCAVVPATPFGWNDVGSWDAWAEHFNTDEQKNLLKGDAIVIDSKGCVVCADKRFVAVVGAEDLVVIDSGDALLVCPRDKVQDVRKVVDELRARGRQELI